MDLIQCVVKAVKADPNEGEDGAVYAGLGYVRKGLRASGRPRNRPAAVDGQPVEAQAKEGASEKEPA